MLTFVLGGALGVVVTVGVLLALALVESRTARRGR